MLEVEDAGGGGYEMRAQRHFMPGTQHKWPLTFQLEVLETDLGGTFQLTATGRNSQERGRRARAHDQQGFERGSNVDLRVQFEASCFNRTPLCGHRMTCSGGECVAAEGDIYAQSRPPDASTAAADGGMIVEPTTGGVVDSSSSCPTEGARACTGHATRSPLLCQAGTWRSEPECAEDERCDSAAGPTRGMCRPIAQECMNKTPDVPFCDADEEMLVCKDLVAAEERTCGENERCVADGAGATCACSQASLKTTNRADRWEQTAVLKGTRPAPSDYYDWSVALKETALPVGAMGDASAGRGLEATPAKATRATRARRISTRAMGKPGRPTATSKLRTPMRPTATATASRCRARPRSSRRSTKTAARGA